jgi:hypothetical protein
MEHMAMNGTVCMSDGNLDTMSRVLSACDVLRE